MIDRSDRTALASALRSLVARELTNDEFEERTDTLHFSDAAVAEIYGAAWHLYSDLYEHKLDGAHALDAESSREVQRWLLFLDGDLEYEWPVLPGWVELLLFVPNLLMFGMPKSVLDRCWFSRKGDVEAWPFLRRADLPATTHDLR
jgi:hypothetical protein